MIRMKPIASVKQADRYYEKSDAGYYEGSDLGTAWLGKGAERLHLTGTPVYEQFKRLIRGLDPHTGGQLTAKLVEHRIPAWDVTASVPKGVTTALERGDTRIQGAIWSSLIEAFDMMEDYATCRVRVDGKYEDRVTGNLVGYAVEHGDTRPIEDKNLPEGHRWRLMPDWDRHIHVVVANLTADDVEGKVKAVKFRSIMEIRRYFDRCFDTILAGKLTDELGYETETTWKKNGKYHSWDIKGIPDSVIAKNSRRTGEVEELEAALVAEKKAAYGDAPDHLSAVARDQLGATSRLEKRGDLTRAECQEFWHSRITDDEGRAVADTINRAMLGLNPRPDRQQAAEKAVNFALSHHGEQCSVFRWEELAATAMERSIGQARPEDIRRAAKRLGVIFAEQDGRLMCTTPALQAEERFIAGQAAAGRGQAVPIGVPEGFSRRMGNGQLLNDGQWKAAIGLLNSSNKVCLVEGPAGAGKSSMLGKFDEGMRRAGETVTYLASTSDAAKELAKGGFEVKTVAHFLLDERLQQAAAGRRIVVDESSMLGHADAVKLFRLAEKLDLKLILVGDPMQHGSVPRGALLHVLKDYGGIQPYRLTEILRQEDVGQRSAVKLLSQGDTQAGLLALDGLGRVQEIAGDAERNAAMAADYVQAVKDGKSALVVSPTHREAAAITAEIRRQLREAGKLGKEERQIQRLVNANASVAERGLASTYQPGDVLLFHQNAKGGFKKGQRLTVADPAAVPLSEAEKFTLYRPETMSVAKGDRLRFTGNVKAFRSDHSYKNGDTATVAGFTPAGNLRLDDGRVIRADAGLLRHGFVETSYGSQGKTVQKAILGMSTWSLGAINQEQIYVSASRAKEAVTIFTDNKAAVMEAVQRTSRKDAALDLLSDREKAQHRHRLDAYRDRQRRMGFLSRVRAAWHRFTTPTRTPPTHREGVRQAERERSHGR